MVVLNVLISVYHAEFFDDWVSYKLNYQIID